MKIVIASSNPGKIHELSNAFIPSFAIDFLSQADFGIEEVAETGNTFIENAIIKARHAAKISKLPTIADDSGLIVDALNGAPGIYSARYAGHMATSQDNIEKLLAALDTIPDEKRCASFHCALVFMAHADDPVPLICEGSWHGIILRAPQGKNGFGYDPIFFVPTENKTAAELPLTIKNRISHRGIAMQLLKAKLSGRL